MKQFIFILFFPLLITAQAPYKKIRVLFIGNSYTYVNNLPMLVHDIALSKGDTLVYDSYAPGGYSFANHSVDASTKAKIMQGTWDYVVLQAQSQEPSFPPGQVSSQTFPYAIKLDSLVKKYNPCAHTVFYETWGRKNGDASNCGFYPPLCTYSGMQNRLRDSYTMFSDSVHALMAPVGEAWRLARATNSLIELYQPDESHPSLEGSYLAASVFYETLFQKTVLTSTYNPGIATSTVSLLNQVAHQLVTDSVALTNIPKYIAKASFSFTTQNSSFYQFQSNTPGFTHHWYFGDGTTSNNVNPSHSYTANGKFTVSLEIYNAAGCKIDSIAIVLDVTTVSGIEEQTLIIANVFPNPCSGYLTIDTGNRFISGNAIVEVMDLAGQVIYTSSFTGRLNTSPLKNGVYYLRISDGKAQSNSCFIKNE